MSVEWLVRGWDQLADEVADYPMTIDDYTNDLTGRDALELVSTWASAPFAAVLRERISSADGRFEASTADDNGVAVSRYFRIDNRSGWWWRRRPTGGPLGAYLDRP